MLKIVNTLNEYLEESKYINYSDSAIQKVATELKEKSSDELELIRNTYHYVRDELPNIG